MTHVYTRERHENKNTRFWATMVKYAMLYHRVAIPLKRHKLNTMITCTRAKQMFMQCIPVES